MICNRILNSIRISAAAGAVAGFLTLTVSARAEVGTLKGKFVYDGTPPAPTVIDIAGKDPDVCGKHKLVDESLVVGPDGGLANVVVYVKTKNVTVTPEAKQAEAETVTLDNKDCRFVPHVVALDTSEPLVVKNSDPTGHNTNISPVLDEPHNPLLAAGTEAKFKFNRSQSVPQPVSCNIHPWMKAWVLPRDNPYFAVTGPDGTFEIKNLPAGQELEFQVWHEKAGYLLAKPEWKKGVAKVKIKAGDNDLGTVKVGPDLLTK